MADVGPRPVHPLGAMLLTAAQEHDSYRRFVLLRDVAYFEWQVLDSNTMEWDYDWDQQGRLPLQLELQMAIGAEGDAQRHVFWLPPKQNPEVLMRQMGSQGQQPRGNPNAPVTGTGTGTGGTGIRIDGGTPTIPHTGR